MDHGGWAVLVTVSGDGAPRPSPRRTGGRGPAEDSAPQRRQALPLDEAVALVERVRVSAERHAKLVLEAVAMTVPGRSSASRFASARRCRPPLPSGSRTTGRRTSPTG